MPVLLLTTIGRRSGSPRTVALGYLRDGDDLVVVGSYAGLDIEPGWARNLRARPEAEVQVGASRWPVRAAFAEGKDRERLWRLLTQSYPFFDTYQRGVRRTLSVVCLRPVR